MRAVLLTAGWFVLALVVNLAGAALVAIAWIAGRTLLEGPEAMGQLQDDPAGFLGGAGFAATFFVGVGGVVALAAAFGRAAGWTAAETWSIRPVRPFAMVAAGLGALTVGLLPGWLMDALSRVLPLEGRTSAPEAVAELLLSGGPVQVTAMVLAVVVGAPILEELAFRGYFWKATESAVGPVGAWLLTSLGFAAFHLDPLQSTALVGTSLFLGWLRWRTGSLVPCIFAHFVNNALAVVATWALVSGGAPTSGDTLVAVPLGVALLGAVFTVTMAAWLGWLTRPAPSTPGGPRRRTPPFR